MSNIVQYTSKEACLNINKIFGEKNEYNIS